MRATVVRATAVAMAPEEAAMARAEAAAAQVVGVQVGVQVEGGMGLR